MIKLLLLFGVVSACAGIKLDGLRVKVGWTGEPVNKEYFFEIPRTIDEAVNAGYKRTRRPVGPLPELRLYCPPGRAVCPMFDDSGFVAGLQLAVPTDEFEVIPVKPEKHFVKWVVKQSATEPAGTYWTTSQYYVSEETLEDGVELDNNETLHDGGVWVKGPHGRLLRIPTTEVELNTTRFRKQSCVPNMGTHYFYNLSKKLRCEDMFPWFPLTSQGQLIGVGFQTYGKLTRKQEPEREWFEHDTFRKGSMKLVAPDAPDCLHDWYERYYGVFLHIYYINDPWNLRCKTTNCPFCFPDSL